MNPASAPDDGSRAPARIPLKVRIRRIVLTGLVILVPVALTVFILTKMFAVMDGIFAPLVDRVIGLYFPGIRIPGLGVLLTVLVIVVIGWLSTKVAGRRLIQFVEGLIGRIPVAKSVYSATKGVMEALSHEQKEAFKRVVLVEYPKANIYALAFVTNSARWPEVSPRVSDFLLVFLPTTPNPTSGYLLLVPREEAIDLPMTVEEGVRMVISGGILLPPPPGAVPATLPAAGGTAR